MGLFYKGNKIFGKTNEHRISMFNNMIISLVKYELIKTTLCKAKELKKIIEPIITLSKKNTINNKRLVFKKIKNNEIIFKLFNILGPKYINKNGGYTRILKCKNRKGDNSKMAYIELIKYKKL